MISFAYWIPLWTLHLTSEFELQKDISNLCGNLFISFSFILDYITLFFINRKVPHLSFFLWNPNNKVRKTLLIDSIEKHKADDSIFIDCQNVFVWHVISFGIYFFSTIEFSKLTLLAGATQHAHTECQRRSTLYNVFHVQPGFTLQ